MPVLDQIWNKGVIKSLAIFLVEDEALIRMMIAGMVEELGHQIVAEAADIDRAVAIAQSDQFDLAILDINVAGRQIDPVAAILARRNIPFVFASGYGHHGLPLDFHDRLVLQKPFLVDALGKIIARALSS
jgi:CheY-like chemotaxis protein